MGFRSTFRPLGSPFPTWWPKISAALSAMSRAVLTLMPLMSSSRDDGRRANGTDGRRMTTSARVSCVSCVRSTRGRGVASSDARAVECGVESSFFREIDDRRRQTTTTTTDDASATR